MIATPSVAPSSRVASFTAEPMPAFSLETTPMIASVAGAVADHRLLVSPELHAVRTRTPPPAPKVGTAETDHPGRGRRVVHSLQRDVDAAAPPASSQSQNPDPPRPLTRAHGGLVR